LKSPFFRTEKRENDRLGRRGPGQARHHFNSNKERECAILLELLNLIGHQRRSRRMSKAEILIIDTA
jgi:hypothetical protein